MKKTSLSILAMALAVVLAVGDANAKKKNETLVDSAVRAYQSNHSFTMPAAGTIEVAFSPDKGSEALVIKVIDATRTELRVLSCRFTSAPVTAALLRAKKRGVDVRVVADHKNNIPAEASGKARAALSALIDAGVDVRTISVYPIHHDFWGLHNG